MKNSKTKTTSPNSSNNEIPNITNQQNSDERKAASKPESITIKNYEKFQHLSKSQNSFPILKSVKIHKEEKTNPTRRYENTFLPDIKENNSKSSEESKAKGKTNFKVIRQFSDKYEMKKSSQREKESKLDANERYDKIKKFFRAKEIKKQKKKIKKENLLLYSVYPGNNIELIRRCMSHRINWREVPTDMNVNVNFVWHPLSSGMSFTDLGKTYDIQMMFNHFENHSVLSNKQNLFISLLNYCEQKSLDVFDYIPITLIIQYDSQNYLRQFECFTNFYNNIKNFIDIKDSNSFVKKKYNDTFVFNYSKKLGNKTTVRVNPNHYSGRNLWIIKAINLNRGRCILIGDTLEKIQKIIKKFYNGLDKEFNKHDDLNEDNDIHSYQTKTKSRSLSPRNGRYSLRDVYTNEDKYRSSLVLLQKYVERPFLYKGRKFDIRLWVLLTHKFEVYAFKEGHLKACSELYNVESIDSFIHLTNYSVQKYSKNFSKFEYGNEIPFADFQAVLDETNPNVKVPDIFKDMCEIIRITMMAVKDKIDLFNRKYCFEIFGYDFILDANLKPVLLEVNTNPGLEESSPLIKMLIPRMIDDAFKLTIDKIFTTTYEGDSGKTSLFPVSGYSDEENLWFHLGNMR